MEYVIWGILAGFVILPWAWVLRAMGDDRRDKSAAPTETTPSHQPAPYPFRKVF